jgi:hypothetical protein
VEQANAGTTPDFSEMNKSMNQKQMDAVMQTKHSADLKSLDIHLTHLKATALPE